MTCKGSISTASKILYVLYPLLTILPLLRFLYIFKNDVMQPSQITNRVKLNLFLIVPTDSSVVVQIDKFKLNGLDYKTLYPGQQLSNEVGQFCLFFLNFLFHPH